MLTCMTRWLAYYTYSNEMTGYRHEPSRLPMNKLKSLLQKTRKAPLFVWKSIGKNTPLPSEIDCSQSSIFP